MTATAERHIDQALDWWLQHREKAPRRLENDLRAAFAMLLEDPEIGASSAEFPGVRRLTVRRVRYEIYYRCNDALVEVLAVWHTSRGDKPKLQRRAQFKMAARLASKRRESPASLTQL